jgi:hypothetical protein
MGPVELLSAPALLDPLPPATLPVTVIVPVDTFCAPYALEPVPPVTLPVTVIAPVDEFTAPWAKLAAALPPVTLPVMLIVPEAVLFTAMAPPTVPPVQFPTIVPTAGDAAVNCKQLRVVVVDLLVTFAVSVTPLANVKMPVPALLTSSQVVSTSIVTVWPVLARASSPTVGTTPPVHVAPALKLPVAAEVMRAMA